MAETVSDYFREWVSAWGLKRIFGFLAMASTSCAPTALKPASEFVQVRHDRAVALVGIWPRTS
jgi:hypothetical protein